jgi:hypothetical protein
MAAMSTINATIDVGDDSAGVIAELLQRFPKGQRVRVAISDEPGESVQVPTLAEFMAQIDAARATLPTSPWTTTEEAMLDLRGGERD